MLLIRNIQEFLYNPFYQWSPNAIILRERKKMNGAFELLKWVNIVYGGLNNVSRNKTLSLFAYPEMAIEYS